MQQQPSPLEIVVRIEHSDGGIRGDVAVGRTQESVCFEGWLALLRLVERAVALDGEPEKAAFGD